MALDISLEVFEQFSQKIYKMTILKIKKIKSELQKSVIVAFIQFCKNSVSIKKLWLFLEKALPKVIFHKIINIYLQYGTFNNDNYSGLDELCPNEEKIYLKLIDKIKQAKR